MKDRPFTRSSKSAYMWEGLCSYSLEISETTEMFSWLEISTAFTVVTGSRARVSQRTTKMCYPWIFGSRWSRTEWSPSQRMQTSPRNSLLGTLPNPTHREPQNLRSLDRSHVESPGSPRFPSKYATEWHVWASQFQSCGDSNNPVGQRLKSPFPCAA